jgi:hypothetical protein
VLDARQMHNPSPAAAAAATLTAGAAPCASASAATADDEGHGRCCREHCVSGGIRRLRHEPSEQ